MNKGKALTPKLRFPEFRDAAGWEAQELGQILEESRNSSLKSDPTRRITVRLHVLGVEHREYRGTESSDTTNHFTRRAGQLIYGNPLWNYAA